MEQEFSPTKVVDAVVEFGIIRMRMSVGLDPQHGYIPRLCLWADAASGVIIHFELIEPAEDQLQVALGSLPAVAQTLEGLPREIRLRDLKLAAGLKKVLEPAGISVVVREDLPMLGMAVKSMGEMDGLGGAPEPGLIDVPGMTLDHLHAYAEAAKEFYKARPWQHLTDEDLIAIESPAGPAGTQFAQVLGAGGATHGLGFVGSRKAHETIQAGGGLPHGGLWTLQFGDIDRLPFDDGEMWINQNLPVAGPDAYSSFTHFMQSKGIEYPKPDQLVWAEGLLRAIAATTEDELDAGKWEKLVTTFAGPATYRFSLPLLLEQISGKAQSKPSLNLDALRSTMESTMRALMQQMEAKGGPTENDFGKLFTVKNGEVPEFVPTNDAERAQALSYEARGATGRRQVQLARQALAIDADCTDALLILADRAIDAKEALSLYRRALAAAERQLGPEVFENAVGHFWGLMDTRPYMRALYALGAVLMSEKNLDEAVATYQEMLRLNPNDNQGARYELATALLQSNQLDELDQLINQAYRGDDYAEWTFTRALLEFRRRGDSPQARQRLVEAAERNPHVVPLLTGRRQMPPISPESYTPGSQEEAVLAVTAMFEAWVDTPDAMEWLEKTAPKTPRKSTKAKGSSGKKGKGRK